MSSYEHQRQQHYYQQTSQYPHHQQEPFTQKLYHSTPTARQTIKFATAATLGTALLILSGLVLTGTVLSLVVATPVLVLFSPILVPAAITVFLLASGFLFSGGCGVAALSALSWIYQYATGQHPPGSDQLEHARMRIADAASEVKEKAKDNLHYVQHKAHEATHQTQAS